MDLLVAMEPQETTEPRDSREPQENPDWWASWDHPVPLVSRVSRDRLARLGRPVWPESEAFREK